MENNNNLSFKLPILFSFVLIIGMFLGFKLSKSFHSNPTHTSSGLDDLVNLIEREYVDSIDKQTLYNNGIEGILKTLDPHTVYIPAKDLTRVNEQLEGSFYGVGMEFFVHQDTVYISSIIPDGPSEKSGIKAGDIILKLDTTIIAGKSLSDEEIVNKIRGQKNKPLNFTILHPDKKINNYTIKRGIVPIKSVQASFKLNDTTGYISIKIFSENTYQEFKEALQKLINQKIKHLVIDVRDNPGGYMNAVAKIADELIEGNHKLISTIGKNNQEILESKTKGFFEKGTVSVLVNEYSASASEILAGIIQDLDRGKVIGRRTYGKGLVQEQFELPDHSAIRITVARYYLPSGRCIQKSYQNGKETYEDDIESRYKNGQLTVLDTSKPKSTQKYYTTKKIEVFANQGITPDVFVKLDTSFNQKLVYYYTKHIAELFTSKYYFFNPHQFSEFKDIYQFHQNFKLTNEMKLELIRTFITNKIEPKILGDIDLKEIIENGIKAEFSKLLFHSNGKYYEQSFQDKTILKAIE